MKLIGSSKRLLYLKDITKVLQKLPNKITVDLCY